MNFSGWKIQESPKKSMASHGSPITVFSCYAHHAHSSPGPNGSLPSIDKSRKLVQRASVSLVETGNVDVFPC
jgi:hypothetical protein